jgi:hypothetical protein
MTVCGSIMPINLQNLLYTGVTKNEFTSNTRKTNVF